MQEFDAGSNAILLPAFGRALFGFAGAEMTASMGSNLHVSWTLLSTRPQYTDEIVPEIKSSPGFAHMLDILAVQATPAHHSLSTATQSDSPGSRQDLGALKISCNMQSSGRPVQEIMSLLCLFMPSVPSGHREQSMRDVDQPTSNRSETESVEEFFAQQLAKSH